MFNKSIKNRIIFFHFFLFLINSYESKACGNSILIKKINNIEIYLGSLNRFDSSGSPGLYKANNQRIIAEICIKNKEEPEEITISVCQDESCNRSNENYEVKYLTSWYKDGNFQKSVFHDKMKTKVLMPELLIKSGDLILVDKENKKNLIKTIQNNKPVYISSEQFEQLEMPDKNGRIKHDAIKYMITDSGANNARVIDKEQLIYIFERSTDKQTEILISLKKGNENIKLKLPVFNFPITLDEQDISTGIYYRGLFNNYMPTLSSERKTGDQLRMEFSDMIKKGIKYPTVYLYDDYQEYMSIRNEHNFPSDKIFIIDNSLISAIKKNDWSCYRQRIKKIKNDPYFKKYKKLYFYLIDEPNKDKYNYIISRIKQILDEEDVSFFVAGKPQNLLHNIVDRAVYVLAYEPSKAYSKLLNSHNAQAYTYANPQIGVYGPNRIRLNYGFKVISNNYSGIMPYAYQDSRGSQWSDTDHPKYRDHMLTYPTSNGLIDTIHGLSLENAIIDIKYMATLTKLINKFKEKCKLIPSSIISEDEINEDDLDTLRLNIATMISNYQIKIEECTK